MNAYQIIKNEIITGHFEPGRRLTEEELAEHLNVSRTPIREAIKQLEADGLVIPYRRRGVTVRSFSEKDIRQIYNLRTLLESYATGEAALHRTEEQIKRMEQTNAAYGEHISSVHAGDMENIKHIQETNQAFHSEIFKAAHNEHLVSHIAKVVVVPLIFRAFYWYSEQQLTQSMEVHKNLINAIKDKEPDRAKAAMQEHIYLGRDHVLKHIRQ